MNNRCIHIIVKRNQTTTPTNNQSDGSAAAASASFPTHYVARTICFPPGTPHRPRKIALDEEGEDGGTDEDDQQQQQRVYGLCGETMSVVVYERRKLVSDQELIRMKQGKGDEDGSSSSSNEWRADVRIAPVPLLIIHTSPHLSRQLPYDSDSCELQDIIVCGDYIYVSDGHSRIHVMHARTGQWLHCWGGRGTYRGQMQLPSAMVLSRGHHSSRQLLFVMETINSRIQAFS